MTDDSKVERPERIERFSRRDLLRLGLVGGAASLLSACGWKGGRLGQSAFAAAGDLNDWVGERLWLSPTRLAPTYEAAERTPEGSFPAYFRSRTVPVLTDSAGWGLEIGGLVSRPMRLTLDQLQALPRITYTVKHHCVEGWTAIGTWTGAPLSAIAALVEPLPAARFLRLDSFDVGYSNGFDLASAMHPQTILAYAYNDRLLTPQHGAPLRLYSPIKLGYKMTKYLTRIDWTAERHGGYWEDRGYPWFGGI